MNEVRQNPAYTEFRPRWYRAQVSTWWWLGRWSYLKFILREISSVFVAWFVAELLLALSALSSGPGDYGEFQDFLRNPFVVATNVVSLFFVIFHAVTWFNLAPKAMAVRVGGKRIPDLWIEGPNYLAWAVVSAIVAWFLLRA
ncbi:MAG TPA: fumarate reductase subunit C [Candidatus Angelobacter sp.]|jgi:fumarate reductase subunit C|nr:fumarate reductase subunit C [Candidatus Angelobacter sp.]